MATEAKGVPVIKQERYALYLAAAPNPMFFQPGSRIQYSRDQVLRRNLPVIDVLLKHGANLYASFSSGESQLRVIPRTAWKK